MYVFVTMLARKIKKQRAEGGLPRPLSQILATRSLYKNLRYVRPDAPPVNQPRAEFIFGGIQNEPDAKKAKNAHRRKLEKQRRQVVHEETVKNMSRSQLSNPGRVKGKIALSGRQKYDTD